MDFCVEKNCNKVAVGVGYWQGRKGTENPHPRRPADKCRTHYLAAVGDELWKVKVVGPAEIADVRTGEAIAAPGEAELDPVETNIAALVTAGFVEVISRGKTKADTKE